MTDGKSSVKQDIEQTRVNHPDKIAAYGEFSDNSTSWGKCRIGSFFLEPHKTRCVDDGNFNPDRVERAFCKNKRITDIETHYNNGGMIGKYNFGLTDSTILLANSAELITRLGKDDYRKTVFDSTECIRNNNYVPNERSLTPDEKREFIRFQRINNPNYDIDNGYGTMLVITNLIKVNDEKVYEEVCQFMNGLYSEEASNPPTWKLFNWTKPEKGIKDECDAIIKPNDLIFGCIPVVDKIVNVYSDGNGKSYYVDKEYNRKRKHELKYSFRSRACFFEEEHRQKEALLFGTEKYSSRSGFQVRRGGRLLTGIFPKLWGLHVGMNRAKGFRVFVDLPINDSCDEDWCIGTFKKITDDTWKHFQSELKEFINTEFKDLVNLEMSDRKKKQKSFQKEYEDKYKNINTFKNKEDLENEYSIHFKLRELIMSFQR